MKPLNEKERDSAFMQFISLFTITLILVMVFVLFNSKVKTRQSSDLKTTNKELRTEIDNLDHISYQIDSIVGVLQTLDKLPSTEFQVKKNDIRSSLNEWSPKFSKDSTTFDKIKYSLSESFKRWTTDKEYVNTQLNQAGNCEELKKYNTDLEKKFQELQSQFETYKSIHY